MDESVDIVDESGMTLRVIGKHEAHAKGLLHTCVIGLPIDSRGRIMLVRQSRTRQDAGQYVCPVGGHVTAGESEDDALRREADEEIGYQGSFAIEVVGRAIFRRETLGRDENHVFVQYVIRSDQEPTLNHEADEYAYFTEEDLKRTLKEHPEHFGDSFLFCVRNFFPNLRT